MPVSPLPQSPHRQDRKVFLTPLIGDVFFSEVRDCNRILIPEYGTPHPDTDKWPDHKLVYVKSVDIERNEIFEFFYAADRENQDLYNFQFSQADIGGVRFDSVVRTYVSLRANFTPTNYEMGATMPDSPSGLFTDTYVLSEYKQVDQQDQALNSLYVTEQLTYIKKTILIQNDFDEYFGENVKTTQSLNYATEVADGSTLTTAALFADSNNAYWGLQSSGIVRSGKQLTAKWFVITEAEAIPASIVADGRTYFTTVNFAWPAELDPYIAGGLETWEKRDGGTQTYFQPKFLKNQYSGPCRAKIDETFSITPSGESTAVTMQPLPINISNPYFSISIAATLHGSDTLSFTNGTSDAEFVYTAANYSIEGTTPATRPAEIIAVDEVTPFRGGYLRRVTTVYAPTT